MLAAGSVVNEDDEVPPEVLAAGAPAEVKKELVEVDRDGRARVPGASAPVHGVDGEIGGSGLPRERGA